MYIHKYIRTSEANKSVTMPYDWPWIRELMATSMAGGGQNATVQCEYGCRENFIRRMPLSWDTFFKKIY